MTKKVDYTLIFYEFSCYLLFSKKVKEYIVPFLFPVLVYAAAMNECQFTLEVLSSFCVIPAGIELFQLEYTREKKLEDKVRQLRRA